MCRGYPADHTRRPLSTYLRGPIDLTKLGNCNTRGLGLQAALAFKEPLAGRNYLRQS